MDPGNVIHGYYDVVVVGGGVAGSAAAIAAAREGARTILVEKGCMLGGLATLGLVAIYLPLCDGEGNQVIMGLGEELLHASIRYGPGRVPEAWGPKGTLEERRRNRFRLQFNPASFALALEESVLESNADIVYDAVFTGVTKGSDGSIESVSLWTKSGQVNLGCKCVVDATGDADVCHAAGLATETLDTNRRTGWYYSFDGVQPRLHMVNDPLYSPTPEGSRTYDGTDWRDVTGMVIDGHRMTLAHLTDLRDKEQKPDAYPLLIPSMPQFRMTRRLKGLIELHEDHDKVRFDDAIGMTGDWRKPGPVYSIPYRSLITGTCPNIIAAGRCISAHVSAWDITRVIPPCAVTGEAAGTAAAMAADGGTALQDLGIETLQSRLRAKGAFIAGYPCDSGNTVR